jgi:hypothetical protein
MKIFYYTNVLNVVILLDYTIKEIKMTLDRDIEDTRDEESYQNYSDEKEEAFWDEADYAYDRMMEDKYD